MPLPNPNYQWLTVISAGGQRMTKSPVVPLPPAFPTPVLNDVWESSTEGLIYFYDGTSFVLAQPGPAIIALQNQMTQALDGISTNAAGLNATNQAVTANQQELSLHDQQISQTQAIQTTAQQNLVNLTSRVAALEAAGTTPAVPQAPTFLTPGTITNTTVALSWTAPAAGPAVTGYRVQFALFGVGNTGVFGPTPGLSTATSPYTVTGLTSGQAYAFHVAAENAAGTGPISNQVVATTTTTFTPSPAFFQIPRDGNTIVMNDGRLVTLSAPDATGAHMMIAPAGTPGGAVAMGISTDVDIALIDTSGAIYQHSTTAQAGSGWWFVPANWQPPTPWTSSPADPRPTPPPVQNNKQALINFIGGMSGNHVIVGQYCDSATVGIGDAIAFTTATAGKHVAILGDGYWPLWGDFVGAAGTAGRTVAQINTDAINQWNAGGLVYLNIGYPDPVGGNMFGTCDPVQVTTPGTAQYNFVHAYYDQCIAGLLALKAAGVIVIFRPLFENRWGFWWGFRGSVAWTAPLWIKLWQQHHDYVVAAGCDHLIWVLSQWSFPADGTTGNIWGDTYPGDNYVDLIGEDVYTNNAPDYSTLYANERIAHPTKPWVMAEWGAGNPSQGNFNFNMQTLINDIKNSMPATCFFQAWAGDTLPFGWRLASMQNLAGAMNDPYVLTRENLNRPALVMTTAPPQAAAVGYNTKTFGSNVTLGQNWFIIDGTNVQNGDGSMTTFGTSGFNAQVATALMTGGGTGGVWTGTAFGGGGYFEATLKWPGTTTQVGGGWPAFWSNDVEMQSDQLGPSSHWPGQAAGYSIWFEPDFFEAFFEGSYGAQVHNWYGASFGPGVDAFTLAHTFPAGFDHNVYHKYGLLWVTATPTRQGYAAAYIDGVEWQRVSWNFISGTVASPPVLSGGVITTGGFMDSRHLYMIMGSGPSNPMTVSSVEVWQASSANNITH